MDCSLPGFSIHGIFQARVLEWGATAFSIICRVHHEKSWAGRSTSWNQECGEKKKKKKKKTAGRNINNLRYADDTTHMAESEEELKSLLKKVKQESEKVGLKRNIQKTKIMASGPSLHGKQMVQQWKQ